MSLKKTKIIMGMPITIEIVDVDDTKVINEVFNYFKAVDKRFSTYKATSEISKINNGLNPNKWSSEMKKVLELCEQTKQQTKGYFNIDFNGKLDPSGLVKGWAINNAAGLLRRKKIKNFYIDAGGDIQVSGYNQDKEKWKIGIRNPFDIYKIVKVLAVSDVGVATSGLYIRGDHIYNPIDPNKKNVEVKSLTVVGPNIYESDRYATAAFAMGTKGIEFIESLPGLEAYMINSNGIATFTRGFSRYIASHA